MLERLKESTISQDCVEIKELKIQYAADIQLKNTDTYKKFFALFFLHFRNFGVLSTSTTVFDDCSSFPMLKKDFVFGFIENPEKNYYPRE